MVQGQGQLEHVGAYLPQAPLRQLERGIRLDPAFQRIAEFAHVHVLSETPTGVVAVGQVGFQVGLELVEGVEGRPGRARVVGPQIVGNRGAQSLVDQLDIALILLDGHLGPDVRRRDQVDSRLVEIQRHLLQAGDDVLEALRLGSVLEHRRVEQRIAERLDVQSRIVQGRVHLVQVEQRECGLVLKDGEVRLLLGRKLVEAQQAQPLLEPGVKAALVVDGLGAEVIQFLVEALFAVFVQPDAGREGGGEGKYGVDELFREAGELLGGAFVAASGGDQQEGEDYNDFRHRCNCTVRGPVIQRKAVDAARDPASERKPARGGYSAAGAAVPAERGHVPHTPGVPGPRRRSRNPKGGRLKAPSPPNPVRLSSRSASAVPPRREL